MSQRCWNCGGWNPDGCIVCRRGKLKLAVLTAPLLILLTACNPDGSNVTWQDVALWGVVGLTVAVVSWAFAWASSR